MSRAHSLLHGSRRYHLLALAVTRLKVHGITRQTWMLLVLAAVTAAAVALWHNGGGTRAPTNLQQQPLVEVGHVLFY